MRVHYLLIALLTMSSEAQEKIPVEIETPHGTVAWKELPREKGGTIAQFLRELSPQELESLKSDAKQAGAFVTRYAPQGKQASHPLSDFDGAFAGWLVSDDPNKQSSDRVIRILGAAYGSYCIEHLGVRWAWIKDEFGEDIALVRENPTTRSFPFTSIRYRIEDKKTNFIYALYASLEHLIKEASPKQEPNQVGAAKGSQPIRSETNQTSSAAGSGR
jgi:hypothetical protein